MMLGKNHDKITLPGLSPKNHECHDNINCNFIRNSKRARSIMLANQCRKQAFVHQVHRKDVYKKKFKQSLNPSVKKINEKMKSQCRENISQVELEVGKGHHQRKSEKFRVFKNGYPFINRPFQETKELKVMESSKKMRTSEDERQKKVNLYPKIKKFKIFSYKEISKFEDEIYQKSMIDEKQVEGASQRIKYKKDSNKAILKKNKADELSLHGWTHKMRAQQTSYGFNIN